MDNFITWQDLAKELGLSQHPNQVVKRRAKYPRHFSEIDNVVYVSKQYANFLNNYNKLQQESFILKKGGSYE